MQAWSAPDVPQLPGKGTVPRLRDTASDRLVAPAGPVASLYVCGITPYDATHLGHANTYVAFDLLARAWRDAGLEVRHAQNVTDVDDPLLERANRDGVDWRELAAEQEELFAEDMAALLVLPPTRYAGVVESLPLIIDLIGRLRGRGVVYEVDGDLYYSVASDPAFGSVSGLSATDMAPVFAERGGDPDRPGKKDPLDSLLWRAERPGEPAWDSPFGRGRPGWHVECAAIALEELGETVDVTGGGTDLVFPHHETCASLARVVTGVPTAGAHAHAGMVAYDGEKMSKSLGNLVFVSKLRESGVDPTAIRLALLAHHYRADWEWTPADLDAATARLDRWRRALASPSTSPSPSTGLSAVGVLTTVRGRLADDLDAPGALTAVDAWAAEAVGGRGPGADDAATALVRAALDSLLGIRL